MECPHCTADLPEADVFCEECGKPLAPPDPVPSCVCGTPLDEADEDGFCGNCGRRVRPRETDHMEAELSPAFAAVSDRGKRHDRNEDRFAIRQGTDRAILAICDGVSNSRESELASSLGVETIASLLETADLSNPETSLRAAMAEAAGNIAKLGPEGSGDAPSTTAVAALVVNGVATIGWAGDSRAYWIDEAGPRQLTADHSWMNRVVSSGEMSEAQAERSPKAHSITRWFGADAGEDSTPDVVTFPIPGEGTLLLCTDGLWNYAPELTDLTEEPAVAAARRFVDFANSKGGQDNITVALHRFSRRPKQESEQHVEHIQS